MHKSTVLPGGGPTCAKGCEQGWGDGDKRGSPTRMGGRIVHIFTAMHIPLGMNMVATAVQP
jgi:hypothetical protein